MGCGSCGSNTDGKPSGCKSNGGCSSGGCNRLNVFDWLGSLPMHDGAKPYPIIEVSFNKGSRKDFFRNNTPHIYEKGEWIAVEGVSGFDMGEVSLTGELVKLQMKKYGAEDNSSIKRVLRQATEEDFRIFNEQKAREQEVMVRSRAIAKTHNLEMKICEVEMQADGKKATFFYTADQRVDFRELIKNYASDFRVKVEMKQIGARQESAKVGGIGSCGRELCCSTWLTDFKSVNTTAARYQNLSINQTKLSGQCGRLKCCLNYELDTYMDALRVFPDQSDSIQTIKGTAYLQKRDIFKNLMWYSYPESSKQYPLTITRVKEILELNRAGEKPEELKAVELETADEKKGIKVDVGFVNDVGQVSLKSLEKSSKKKKPGNNRPAGDGQKPQEGSKPAQRTEQNRNRSQDQKPPQQRAAPKARPQEGEEKPAQKNLQPKPQQKQARPQEPKAQRPQNPQQNPRPHRPRPNPNRPNEQRPENPGT